MKLAVINAPWWVRYCPPYILGYMKAYLESQGHEVSLHDLNNKIYHEAVPEHRKYWDDRDMYSFWENPAFVDEIVSRCGIDQAVENILGEGNRLVAFTTHTTSVLFSYEVAKRIKKNDPGVAVVFFGHKASRCQMAEDFAKQPFIDYVCAGEADMALNEIAKRIEAGRDASGVPGVITDRNGSIIDSGEGPAEKDLDALPFPDYSPFRDDILSGKYAQPGRLDLLDSRGCVNACHFCYERLFWPKYRRMGAERLVEQIRRHIGEFPNVKYFYFNGLLLNGDIGNLEQFCDLLIGAEIKITWAGQAAVSRKMTPQLLKKMKQAGCVWLGYGLESGSQRVLDLMNKRVKVGEAVSVFKNTREAGIDFQVNVMFGFPGETMEDFGQTLKLLVEARPYISSILASQSFFTLEKGTFVYNNPDKFGITGEKHHLFWESDEGRNNYAERFRRYEEFCELALKLGIPETSGVLKVKPDKWSLLGSYYMHDGQYGRALECFKKSLKLESDNAETRRLISVCLQSLKKEGINA
ncbi:MAG: radical SAM protein [Endomicrobiales bacterium]|nr:radical SAM protein [Endomicrobiales bacterium]